MAVTTSRPGAVALRPVPVEDAYRLLRGEPLRETSLRFAEEYPTGETLDALALVVGAHEMMAGHRVTRLPPWWLSYVVVDGVVVGDAGFHGPPAGGGTTSEVEIGYQVVPAYRRRGIATRACALIVAQAYADGADVVVAETAPENLASRRVLLGNGFRLSADGRFERYREAG